MFFGMFSTVSIIIAVIAVFVSVFLLKKISWIFGWLRGTTGILFLVVAGALAAVNVDLLSYHKITNPHPIATLSFTKIEKQYFDVTLVLIEDGVENNYKIHGDQWQMDAKVITWDGFFATLGGQPGYRLDRLSGRYFTLEDERTKERSIHQLIQNQGPIDFWSMLNRYKSYFPWAQANYGSATFLPMADGAIFQVSLTTNGLVATPINQIAEQAIKQFL